MLDLTPPLVSIQAKRNARRYRPIRLRWVADQGQLGAKA
jgi:hypothetical protein